LSLAGVLNTPFTWYFSVPGNHPKLVAIPRRPESMLTAIENSEAGAKGSGKIERLMELLEEIVEGGEALDDRGWLESWGDGHSVIHI